MNKWAIYVMQSELRRLEDCKKECYKKLQNPLLEPVYIEHENNTIKECDLKKLEVEKVLTMLLQIENNLQSNNLEQMDRKIKSTDFVDKEQIKVYQEIDGLRVIEELLLFRGLGVIRDDKSITRGHLDDMALILYGLKENTTNKLYIGLHLDRFYLRHGLKSERNGIKVPIDIYNKVKGLNEKYIGEHSYTVI